jgi:hypothetical protein
MYKKHVMNLSPEKKLLLYCSHINLTKGMQQEIDLLIKKSIDWIQFLDYARWHSVSQLVFVNLKKSSERSNIPLKIIESLKTAYRENLVRNTIIFDEYEKIITLLDSQKIQVIPLKGIAIAKTIYSDIGLRPMSDIDILVKRENLQGACKLMSDLGFKQVKHTKPYHHINYIIPKINLLVEIHYDIESKHHPSLIRPKVKNLMEVWWSRVQREKSDNQIEYYLHPMDLICLLSHHFIKHRFTERNDWFSSYGALRQLCDLYFVIEYYQNDIDWEQLKIELQKFGLYKVVSVTLSVVNEVFFETFGRRMDFLVNWEIESSEKKITKFVSKRIFNMEDRYTPVPLAFVRAQTEISPLKRFKTIIKKVYPNPEILSKRLNKPINSKLFYLNYLTHTLNLCSKYGKTMIRRQHLKMEGKLIRWINEIK